MHDVNKAVLRRASLSDQAVAAARQVLAGQRGGLRAYLTFAGEQHGFRREETITTALEAELSFLGQVLGFEPVGIAALRLME